MFWCRILISFAFLKFLSELAFPIRCSPHAPRLARKAVSHDPVQARKTRSKEANGKSGGSSITEQRSHFYPQQMMGDRANFQSSDLFRPPFSDSSSDNSSLFDDGSSCSTESTRDSASTEENWECMSAESDAINSNSLNVSKESNGLTRPPLFSRHSSKAVLRDDSGRNASSSGREIDHVEVARLAHMKNQGGRTTCSEGSKSSSFLYHDTSQTCRVTEHCRTVETNWINPSEGFLSLGIRATILGVPVVIPQPLPLPSTIVAAIYIVVVVIVIVFHILLLPSLPSNPRSQLSSRCHLCCPFFLPCYCRYPTAIFLPSSSAPVACRYCQPLMILRHRQRLLPSHVNAAAFFTTRTKPRRYSFAAAISAVLFLNSVRDLLPQPTCIQPPIVGTLAAAPSSSVNRNLDHPHLLLARAKKGSSWQFPSPRSSPCRRCDHYPQPLPRRSLVAASSPYFHPLVPSLFLCFLRLPTPSTASRPHCSRPLLPQLSL
ncbi:hypothetical protein GW17_00007568 [Ensete ventricosum]|nr:hypothetical protein GW17_00007568 [Ensete ventricosum]